MGFAALLGGMDTPAVAGSPGATSVQTVVSVATTLTSARQQGTVTVSGINWDCRGASCKTSTAPAAVASPVAVCQGLAREVGPMGSFEVASRKLSSIELQQCNSVLPAVLPAGKVKTPDPAAKSPAARAPRSYPVNLRTAELTVTGTGRLAALLPFTGKVVRTAELTVTGMGRLTALLPFTPKVIRTAELTVTGTGVIR